MRRWWLVLGLCGLLAVGFAGLRAAGVSGRHSTFLLVESVVPGTDLPGTPPAWCAKGLGGRCHWKITDPAVAAKLRPGTVYRIRYYGDPVAYEAWLVSAEPLPR